jgi:hypothetical protein
MHVGAHSVTLACPNSSTCSDTDVCTVLVVNLVTHSPPNCLAHGDTNVPWVRWPRSCSV